MKSVVLFCAAVAYASAAAAADKLMKFRVDSALAKGQNYKARIDPAINLYFANQPAPASAKTVFQADSGHRRTNDVNKPDQEACDIAFVSAVVTLQQQARRSGGNAVVNITSYFKDDRLESATEYLCGVGSMMAAVGLHGSVVTVEQ